MIYLETSTVLAQLLAEERGPPPAIWREPLIAGWRLWPLQWPCRSTI